MVKSMKWLMSLPGCVRLFNRPLVNGFNELTWPNLEQWLAELDWLAVFHQHLSDATFGFGFDLLHPLHGFDDALDRLWLDFNAAFDIRPGFRRTPVGESANARNLTV